MTPEEETILERCVSAVCTMCKNPKWNPAVQEDMNGFYHKRVDGKGNSEWCDATLIWWEFGDDNHE